MFYTIFCTLNGKTISTITGDYANDEAAIQTARWYQQSSAADTIRVHRDWMYPLGELVAELKALPPDPQTPQHTPGPWKVKTYSQVQSLKRPEVYGPSHPDGGEYAPICSVANEADARLIGAAPDMLEILREQTDAAQDVIDNWSSGDLAAAVNALEGLIEPARAVIAKTAPPTA